MNGVAAVAQFLILAYYEIYGQCMYQSGFRPVLSAMVDPEIRVIVTAEFGRIDESHRCIAVAFDPLLERGRMTMPAPEYLASLYERDNRTAPPVIFRSEQEKELAKFFVKNQCAVDRLELHLEEGDKPLSFYGYTEQCRKPGFFLRYSPQLYNCRYGMNWRKDARPARLLCLSARTRQIAFGQKAAFSKISLQHHTYFFANVRFCRENPRFCGTSRPRTPVAIRAAHKSRFPS